MIKMMQLNVFALVCGLSFPVWAQEEDALPSEVSEPSEAPSEEAAAGTQGDVASPTAEKPAEPSPETAAAQGSAPASAPAPASAVTEVPPSQAAAQPEASAPAEFNPEVPDSVGTGQRVIVKEGELSMNGPSGWSIYTKHPSLTLLMQAPKDPNLKYQRTIQVAGFAGPKFIDNVTAKEFEQIITQKFSMSSVGITDFNLRNHTEVELADGREGILFYSSFKINDVSLMQAHILVSSGEKHYLLTYTDVVEHFESDSSNQYLTEAWDAMISTELNSKTPVRFETGIYVVAGIALVIVLLLVWVVVARRRAGNEYREYADHGGKEESGIGTLPSKSIAEKSGAGLKTVPEPSYLSSSFPTGLSQMPESIQPSDIRPSKGKKQD